MRSKIDLTDMVSSLYQTDSAEDFCELWNAFVTLRDHRFIPESDWRIFSDVCDDLYYDEERDFVVNPLYE